MFFIGQFLVFLCVLVITIRFLKWWNGEGKSDRQYPPSLYSLPIVGSLPFLKNYDNISNFFLEKAQEIGSIFTFRVGSRLVLVLNSKEAMEKTVVRHWVAFAGRPHIFIENVINPEAKGIVFAKTAAELKSRERTAISLLRDFGLGMKNAMQKRILVEIEAMIEYLQKTNGNAFDPHELCLLATSNIILNMLFGRRQDYSLGVTELFQQLHRYIANFSMIFDLLPFLRFIPPYNKRISEMRDCFRRIAECVEREKRESLRETAEPCFIRSYIEKLGSKYDEEELIFTVRDLGQAGMETSTTVLMWSLIALANNPQVQKRLHAEIDAVLPHDGHPTVEDQAKLPYVEATILEILRWRTVAPLSLARETICNCVVDGYFIPSGTMVLLNLHGAHFDPKTWKNPELFQPERFLDEENNVIGRERIVTFSLGRRSCPGESMARCELFLILTSLVKRFLILPPEGEEKVSDKARPVDAGELFPMPFRVRLIERK